MSVIKSKRQESPFQVKDTFYHLRDRITELALNDFGYKPDKVKERLLKRYNGDLSTEERLHKYNALVKRQEAYNKWFMEEERKAIIDCLRDVMTEIFLANSIYPTSMDELMMRREHQDVAIGHCNRLKQELQYIIRTLPVDMNCYTDIALEIEREIKLLKGWRKSDNKFKNKFLEPEKEENSK